MYIVNGTQTNYLPWFFYIQTPFQNGLIFHFNVDLIILNDLMRVYTVNSFPSYNLVFDTVWKKS